MSSEVRAFFVSTFQVILITMVIIGLIFSAIGPDPDHYFAGSRLHVELLKKTPSPRIILVGGSNVSFGIDAALMQKSLGIPVINDGLHAGLGVAPLRELQDYVRSGDTVIISLEYNMFTDPDVMRGDHAFLSDWIEYSPQRIKYLSNPWKETPGIYAIMLQRKVNRQVNTYLFGGSLDEVRNVFVGTKYDLNGDFIGHLDQTSTKQQNIPATPYPVAGLQKDIFVFLEQFAKFAHEKGVRVFFAAPASRQSNCKATGTAQIENFFTAFAERSSIPMLTPLEDVCLPNKYFFDTEYHLNAQGREIRTQRLIENWISFTTASK
jgi:hypothetical protein